MKNLIWVLIAGSIVLLSACGGGSDTASGGGEQSGDVVFSVDPVAGPTCHNNDAKDEFQGSSGYMSVSCRWFCAPHFDGQSNVYVSITFEKSSSTGNRWILDRKYLSDGICF